MPDTDALEEFETARSNARVKVLAYAVAWEMDRKVPGAFSSEAMETLRSEAVNALRGALIGLATELKDGMKP